ncbi:Nodule Cysteine-Rich (NCR) secreted peptide [Medicago truncatula]|uniref:Nodule Cysteine-Rich (NCR) secreted peptide n=1 Tax=Medicago truncatula TaxID=3880 RepID=A0A072UKQ0_MEDTR|nr:Nodule Cysteine-Rich (NCR) secreted peptide [Medicago truncatula]
MVQILSFVHALILFLSLFLVAKVRTPCVSDDDCLEAFLPPIWKCVHNFCEFNIRNIFN